MHSDTSLNQLPMRWDYYLDAALDWAKLLAQLELKHDGTVVELGPGWAPKIVFALSKISFSGNYLAVDQNQLALDQLWSFMAGVPIEFNMHQQVQNVLQPLPKSDLIVMNHVLDDMLLAFLYQKKPDAQPYSQPENVAQLDHDSVNIDDEKITQLANQLVERISQSLNPGGLIIIFQYPGYLEKLYQTHHLWEKVVFFISEFQKTIIEPRHQLSIFPKPKNLPGRYNQGELLIWKKV